ncbi:MAG: amino acid aminotransferase [Pseudomonadota bacterium]
MPTGMIDLPPVEADPLLGLLAAVRADTREGKVDLGVGIYKDAAGQTPVLASVRAAERKRIEAETTKVYESAHGNSVFGEEIGRLVLGAEHDRHTVFATPGGSGALFIAMRFLKRLSPDGRVFISKPCWPNHLGIAHAVEMPVLDYPYVPKGDGFPDFDQLLAGLEDLRAGDSLLLQGPCHNPTGTDLSAEQWNVLADKIVSAGAIPLIDMAYQGFAYGLEEDVAPLRAFLAKVPEALITYSCSKNFGLYRERTGALIVQAASSAGIDRAASHLAAIIRTAYSMPPSNGAAIVANILSDPGLERQWRDELETMRLRLQTLRDGLAAALIRAANDDRFSVLAEEKGMFSILPLTKDGIVKLREEHAIYMPGSGRINVAGLPEDRLDEVAAAIAPHLVR